MIRKRYFLQRSKNRLHSVWIKTTFLNKVFARTAILAVSFTQGDVRTSLTPGYDMPTLQAEKPRCADEFTFTNRIAAIVW